jgi:hypothetical protein
MKKLFLIVFGALALSTVCALAVDDYTQRDVRDPRKLAARLTADFTSVVSTSDAARVTALEAAPVVTNATAATVLTFQTVTITNVYNDITNVVKVVTNATAATTMTLQR